MSLSLGIPSHKGEQDCDVPFSGVASWDEDSDPDSAAEFSLLTSEVTSFNLGGLYRETKAHREGGCLGGLGRPTAAEREALQLGKLSQEEAWPVTKGKPVSG